LDARPAAEPRHRALLLAQPVCRGAARPSGWAMSGSRRAGPSCPAKDDSAFPVAVIMISRRGRAENQAAPKMATVSSGMLGKREGREIGF
jgi:hypothetical protein